MILRCDDRLFAHVLASSKSASTHSGLRSARLRHRVPQGGRIARSIYGLAYNLSKAFTAPYTPDYVRTQINLLRINPHTTSRAWANAAIHQWQPDALELLKAHADTMTAKDPRLCDETRDYSELPCSSLSLSFRPSPRRLA